MKLLIESILKMLVDAPGEVRITEISGAKTAMYELRCNERDMGRVIGKGGKTISSLRTLLNALASREGRKAVFEAVD